MIRGMAETLQDCHTFFLSPVLSDTLIDTRAGKGSVGIGVELASVPPLVTEVITGGPAALAGIVVGDRIATIDGIDATSFGPASALDRINGDEGTSVRLQLRRPGQPSFIDVTLTRQRVNPPNVDFRTIGQTIGYVRIRNFIDGGIYRDLRAVLDDFERRGVTGWILDLRGNPGGRLDNDAISLFVKDGLTVRARGRDGGVEEYRATDEALVAVRPMVLLTNNQTGSVAEVFAAALQEYGLAYVIGSNTNGCVGYTDVQDFGDGTSLAVTTHVNLGPVSGTVLNGVGVAPDLAVARTSDDIANARDPQLDAAVARLSR
jgi:carboxyl-terminal processing protease